MQAGVEEEKRGVDCRPGLRAGGKLSMESENSKFEHGLLGHYQIYFSLWKHKFSK